MNFAFSTETDAVLRRRAKTLKSYRFSICIFNNFRPNRIFRKNVRKSANSHDFHHFHQNSPNFAKFTDFFDFMVLGPQSQGSLQTGHAFKAQMVTHFVISRHLRGNLKIYRKNIFPWNFSCWSGIYDFLIKNALFRSWASKTRPRCLHL